MRMKPFSQHFAYRAGTTELLGMDDVRTELCYRSKRYPVLHFGLGAATAVDVEIVGPDTTYLAEGLEADRVHYLALDQLVVESSEPVRENDIRVYPNPAGDRLFVRGAESSGRFEIRDMAGRMRSVGNWSAEGIPVAGLAPGVYFLRLQPEEGPEVVVKFIKQ